MNFVYIRWLDAGARHRIWLDPDELDARFELHSAGFLVCEGEDYITLAADFDGVRYRDVATIPSACIIEKKILVIKTSKTEP
jgi:hypothetical protein